MKPFSLSAAFLLLALSPAAASPETCVASAPNGNSLRVYDAPRTNGPVLGGIGVGTCGINVTNQCEGTMCVIAFPGVLNGWVDMRHISNSPVQAPDLMASADVLGTYIYGVTGRQRQGDGRRGDATDACRCDRHGQDRKVVANLRHPCPAA